MIDAKGRTGTVSFDGEYVTLKRMMSKQSRRLAVGSITAVQFRPAGALINGFIHFVVPGAAPLGKGEDESHNENAVIFGKKHLADFERLRAEVEAAISARQAGATGAPNTPPPVTQAPTDTPTGGSVAELQQLAELHRQGALTDEEFATAKKRALGL